MAVVNNKKKSKTGLRLLKRKDLSWNFKIFDDGYTYSMLTITQTYNNFFLTLTDIVGSQVYKTMSGGASGFSGTKRRSQASAELVAKRFLAQFLYDFSTICRKMKIFVVYRERPTIITSIIIDILSEKMPFCMFVENQKAPHNGMRARKLRRI